MRLRRWEELVEWPLMMVAVMFLAAYSVQVLVADPAWQAVSAWVVWGPWAVFFVDYCVSLGLAENRHKWFVDHLLDLATVVLPMLRPLRLLRLVKLVSVLQHVAGNALRGRVVTYVVGSSALLVYVGALAMFDAEHAAPDATIGTFGDALWWAVVSITTVGYGDLSPVTETGRLIAVALMIGGIALVGVVTATLASWLVQRVAAEGSEESVATARQIESLHVEVALLRRELALRDHADRLGSASSGPGDRG